MCFLFLGFVYADVYRNEIPKSKHQFSAPDASLTTYQSPRDAVPIGPKPSNCSTSMCCGPAVSYVIVGAGLISSCPGWTGWVVDWLPCCAANALLSALTCSCFPT